MRSSKMLVLRAVSTAIGGFMPSSRNLFRFISVRPPVFEEPTAECRLLDEGASRDFVDLVDEVQGEGDTYEEARAEAARRVMYSDVYFTRHGRWQQLRPLRRALLELLHAAAEEEGEQPDDEARDLLSGVIDPSELDAWISSDDYADLRHALWLSYIANVAAPNDRAHDRGEMVDWTRILVFLEALAHDRPDVNQCARQLRRARVEIPPELFLPVDREEEPEPEEPDDPRRGRLEELRDSLRRHHRARAQLEELHAAKVAGVRMAAMRPGRPLEESGERGEDREDREDRPGRAEGGMDRRLVPWRLSEDDLSGRDELRDELDRLGLPVDGTYIGEVAARIDQTMGDETSELEDLTTMDDVVGIGSTLSMIRRTQRAFDRPTFGSRST
jgi:hypothetical protein